MNYFKEWFLETNRHPDKFQFWKRLLGDGWNRLEYEDTQWIENILQKIHESFRSDGQSQLWDGKVVYAHEKIHSILKDDICKSDISKGEKVYEKKRCNEFVRNSIDCVYDEFSCVCSK